MAEWRLPLLQTARYAFVEPTADDVEHVAANLRRGDKDEIHATLGHRRYLDALNLALAASTSAVVWVNAYGEPMAVAGVYTTSLLDRRGAPWLMATPAVERYPGALISCGRAYTTAALQEYAVLENYVDDRNKKSVAWLQHVGFSMGEPQPFGALQMPFRKFRIER